MCNSLSHHISQQKRIWLLLHFLLPNLNQISLVAHASIELFREGAHGKHSSILVKLESYKSSEYVTFIPNIVNWNWPHKTGQQSFWLDSSGTLVLIFSVINFSNTYSAYRYSVNYTGYPDYFLELLLLSVKTHINHYLLLMVYFVEQREYA